MDVDPKFARIAKAFHDDPRVTSGKMMAAVGLKVDGKIFAMFPKGTFVAKLPKARVDDLVAAGRGVHFDPGHGRLMKEWIALDGHEKTWLALAREARRFVGGD
jgi:TfoX/Sxy family transcriptional regulator of competence genes